MNAAIGLRRVDAEVTLVDRENYHLFQPLLYQVATGGLSPANICALLRNVLKRQKNASVLKGEVIGFDFESRQVLLEGRSLPFDYLIVAVGMTHSYFGHDDWQPLAPGLKSIAEATDIRRESWRLRACRVGDRRGRAAAFAHVCHRRRRANGRRVGRALPTSPGIR